MFNEDGLVRALRIKDQSYRLLQWLETAIERGFIPSSKAHAFTTVPAATQAWLVEHMHSLPPDTRPREEDLEAFAAYFGTYLDSAFELVDDPGEALYSPEAHCFCCMCSWMVSLPHLRPKKLTPYDKRRADKAMRTFLESLALHEDLDVSAQALDTLSKDKELREALAIATYADDLFLRMNGTARGPMSLALWRRFAWTPSGAPKKKFSLTPNLILDAESKLLDELRGRATP